MYSFSSTRLAFCVRCGTPLSRQKVACTKRGCRPIALRRVTLLPFHLDTNPQPILHLKKYNYPCI
jgi:hypothetical protein